MLIGVLPGVTACAGVTVTLSVPVTPLTVAVIWAVPVATPVTSPDGPTLATVLSELIQVALALTLAMLPSDNVAIAESWSVPLVAT